MQDRTQAKQEDEATGAAHVPRASIHASGTGVSPVKGVSSFTATRRNLPHWEDPGSVYFVTWSTAGKTCLFPDERTLALAAIRYWDSVRWTVYCAVIMPDHVHVLVQPLRVPGKQAPAWHTLGSIIHSVKSYSQ